MMICTDGSPQAESNVHFGGFIAAAYKTAEVLLVGISEPENQRRLSESLERSATWLADQEVQAQTLIKTGDPVPSIVELSRSQRFDLVVIGGVRQKDGGPLALPAKAYALIRQLDSRVLLVSGLREELKNILFCTAGGFKAERAVRFCGNLALATGASVAVFHVMAEPYTVFSEMRNEEDAEILLKSNSALARALRRQRDLLLEMGVQARVLVRYGLVFEEISAEIEDGDYDLVVTGSHPAAGPIREYMLADMTREIVENVDRPILIVRTAQAPAGIFQELRRVFSGWRRLPSRPDAPDEETEG